MNTQTLEDRINAVINNPDFEEFLDLWGSSVTDFQLWYATHAGSAFMDLPVLFRVALLHGEASNAGTLEKNE